MKTIKLPCFGIVVELDDTMVGFGGITSDLGEEPSDPMSPDGSEYNGAIHAIESLILAHAVAGIDIESPAYMEGIETAVDAIGNNLL
ncbi:MAG: hypothetical protein V3V85_04885 [Candidatus Thorarchaeota archaeon]